MGEGFQPLPPPRSAQMQPLCLQTGTVSPPLGRKLPENRNHLSHQAGDSQGRGLYPLPQAGRCLWTGLLPLQSGSP